MRKVSALLCGAAVTATLLFFGPQHVSLNDAPTSDPELAAFMQEHAPRGANNVTGFVLGEAEPVFAGLGFDEHSEVEIGSITKTFNAELLRQAIERGDVSLTTRVDDIIDTHGAPVGSVTLEELANHKAGLPRNPGLDPLTWVLERNPYGKVTRQEVIEMALAAELTDRGTENYSNLGAAFLGQLLAEGQGVLGRT